MFFFFNDTATTEIYTLSLHDALPILAPERKDDEQFLARFSKVVKADVLRIERLTREILDYAKPIEPLLREEDLNDILESCLYTLRVRPSHELITIETDLVQGLPKIFADRQQLKQVFLNFLFRSEEHTSELQSHWYISYAVFCLKKKKNKLKNKKKKNMTH